jgi:hypothetical protein
MTYISRHLVEAHDPVDPAYSTFCGVRTLLASALASWLNTRPANDAVDQETDATVALVRGLVGLTRGAAI